MKIGVIGGGVMGRAMMAGFLRAGHAAQDLAAADVNADARAQLEALGITTEPNARAVAAGADMWLLAVKPQVLEDVLNDIGQYAENRLVVSIVAGKTIEWLSRRLPNTARIIRLMPNTPASIGEGMTAVCPAKSARPEDVDAVLALLKGTGRAEVVPEKLMNAVISVSGSSPAYVFMLIDAMADGAVREGMPRDAAIRFAAQAVLGSAQMVLQSALHPAALKDKVCSPGGTTIEAVAALERDGFRAAVLSAMRACAERAEQL